MALTNLIDTLGLRKLFQKAETGDLQAKRAVQELNNSPELTGAAFASEAKPDLPGLASLPMELTPGRGDLGNLVSPGQPVGVRGKFDLQGMEQRDPKRFLGLTGDQWKEGAMGLQGGIRGYLKAAGRGDIGEGGLTGKWRQEQMDALKRRHAMWDTAYQDSQNLPQEVLTDPKFASLAQAKAALDKDMMDGKVDNEKNVSGFLTELARFRTDLDQIGLLSKVKTQAAGEGMLQKERERMGLAQPMEQKEYNFEGTPVTRSEYLKLAAERDARQERLKSSELIAAENRAGRLATTQLNNQLRQDTLDQRNRAGLVDNYAALMASSAGRYATKDEDGKPMMTQQGYAQMLADNEDAMYQMAQQLGIKVEQPDPTRDGMLRIQGRAFDTMDPRQVLEALTYLDQLIRMGR